MLASHHDSEVTSRPIQFQTTAHFPIQLSLELISRIYQLFSSVFLSQQINGQHFLPRFGSQTKSQHGSRWQVPAC